jgi:hypothetical protein
MKLIKRMTAVLLLLLICSVLHAQIVQAEYFVGADPGQGNGIAVQAADGNLNNVLEGLIKSGIPMSSTGFRKISIRVKDFRGTWGPAFSTVISVESLRSARGIKVALGEYFWDNDPGAGNGVAMVAFDGNFNSALETAYAATANAPAQGKHKLNVRVKDYDGTWGPVFTTVVSVENPFVVRSVRIIGAEYFWDNDPGQGSGTALIAFDGAFDEAIEQVVNNAGIAAPALGKHKFNVRVRDPLGNWGPLFTTVIFTENPFVPRSIKVTAAECFFDTDPGQGNGTTLIAFDGAFDEALEQAVDNGGITAPSLGKHKFNVRLKDPQGTWGPVFTTVIFTENPITTRQIRLVAGEYYWDTDPGQGNGTALFAFDGALDNALETLTQGALTSSLTTGFHKLSTRVKDVANNWGPVFTTVVFIDPCAATPHPTFTINGSSTFCQGDSVRLSAGAGYAGYTWIRGTQTVGTGQNIYVTQSGFYSVIVDSAGCPGASPSQQITVLPAPTVSITGNIGLCPSSSTLLTANATGSITAYQWYRNGSIINPGGTGSTYSATQTGDYTVKATNSGNCSTTSAIFTVVASTAPAATITAGGATTFCPGGSVVLSANTGANLTYQWYVNNSPMFNVTQSSYTATSAGTFTVVVTNAAGCSSTSNGILVTVRTPPTASITAGGPASFCQGDSVWLVAGAGSGYTYQWYNAQGSLGVTNDSVKATASGSFYVVVTDGNGCTTTSGTVTVTVTPLPTATITAQGPTTFCAGGSVQLNASTGNGYTYSWTYNGGGIPFASGSTYTAGASGTYTAIVYTNGNCFKESNTIMVTVNAAAPSSVTASGPVAFCSGDSVVLRAATGSGLTYQWYNGVGPILLATRDSLVVYQSGSYHVTVNNGNNCPSTSGTTTVTVAPRPTVSIAANGQTRFCQGGSVQLQATSTGTNLSYVWYRNGNAIASSNSTLYNASQTGTYNVIVTAVGSCSDTSNNITVTVDTLPVATITANGPTTFCQGDSVTFTATYTGTLGVQWYRGNNPIQGATANTFVADTAGTYHVQVENGNGCFGTSNSFTVTVSPIPVASVTASGPLGFCLGDSVTLTAASGSGYNYQWFENGIGLGITTQSITTDTSGDYTVIITNPTSCSATSANQAVTVWPLPTAIAFAADSTFCLGTSLTLEAVTAAGLQYQWYKDGQFISGSFDSTYVTNLGGNYTVKVTDIHGCTDSSDMLPITANPSPSALISSVGPVAVCTGDSVVMIVNSGLSHTGLTYDWQKDGFSIGVTDTTYTTQIAGLYNVEVTNTYNCVATTATITVLIDNPPTATISATGPTTICSVDSVKLSVVTGPGWTYKWRRAGNYITGATDSVYYARQSGNYSVDVFANAGCWVTSSSIAVTVHPSAAPGLVALTPDTICQGDSVLLLIVNAVQGWDYQWYMNNQPTGGDTLAHLVAYTAGDYSVGVIDTNGCPDRSGVVTVVVNSLPSVNLTAGSAITFCQGDSVTLNAIQNPDYSYLWTMNGDTITGITDTSYTVGAGGSYAVIVTDSNACSSLSQDINVTVNALPSVSITASGSATFCQGDSLVLNATSDTSYTYVWRRNGNLLNDTDNSVSAITSGTYSVSVTDNNSCANSQSTAVTVNPLPVSTLVALGTTEFCAGGNVNLVGNSSSTFSYDWYLDGTLINNQSDSILAASVGGDYTVVVTDVNGCSDSSSAVDVIVNANPVTPVVTVSGNVLSSDAAAGNQWYLNDTLIQGATNAQLAATVSGVYTVVVTNANGCSTESDTVNIYVGIGEILAGMNIGIYPNPTEGNFRIEFKGDVEDQYQVNIYNAIGQLVHAETLNLVKGGRVQQYDLRSLADGVYMVNIESAKGRVTKRLVIQK